MNYWKLLLVGLAGAGLAVASCSHPSGTGMTGTTGTGGSGSGTGGSGDCPAGSVGCPCIGTICDQDLACADLGNGNTQCVTTAGTGGTPGTGGSVATGGTPGTGGSSATGGSPGTGGNGPGTGGSSATGGSPGTGGNPGTGGGSSGTNLIVNGDFSQGDTNWGVPNGNPTSKGVQNGQYCITLNNGSGQVILGWGGTAVSANLAANANYTLSFQASATSSLSGFDTHIGSAVPVPAGSSNYPLDKDVGNDTIGTGLQTFTHMFSLTSADPQAGVAFLISVSTGTSTVCVDNVSLTAD
ncbi:MAG TPA: hypothetical protein VLA79_00700 [Polyangia bacterium]|nr:hypothetical protein [Polyangia bacterium]